MDSFILYFVCRGIFYYWHLVSVMDILCLHINICIYIYLWCKLMWCILFFCLKLFFFFLETEPLYLLGVLFALYILFAQFFNTILYAFFNFSVSFGVCVTTSISSLSPNVYRMYIYWYHFFLLLLRGNLWTYVQEEKPWLLLPLANKICLANCKRVQQFYIGN